MLSFLVSFAVQRLLVWCNPFWEYVGGVDFCFLFFRFVVFENLYKNMCGPTNMMEKFPVLSSNNILDLFLCLGFNPF